MEIQEDPSSESSGMTQTENTSSDLGSTQIFTTSLSIKKQWPKSKRLRSKYNTKIKAARRQGAIAFRSLDGSVECFVVPCLYCGYWFQFDNITIEHIVNRRDKGTDHHHNIALACECCNRARDQRERQEEMEKLIAKGACKACGRIHRPVSKTFPTPKRPGW